MSPHGTRWYRCAIAVCAGIALSVVACRRFEGSRHVGIGNRCTNDLAFQSHFGERRSLHDENNVVRVEDAWIVPAKRLADFTADEFRIGPMGKRVAQLCLRNAYKTNKGDQSLDLRAGVIELWLRLDGDPATPSSWHVILRDQDNGDQAEGRVYARDSAYNTSKGHVAGHAVWTKDDDEGIWVSCARGCCRIAGKLGSIHQGPPLPPGTPPPPPPPGPPAPPPPPDSAPHHNP